MDKKQLTETDIRTKHITPAIVAAGWDIQAQVLEEYSYTKGRIQVRGKLHTRGEGKKLDYLLSYIPNVPLAVVEAKDNRQSIGAGMSQALEYAKDLDLLFAFSSNGDGFLFHDKTATDGPIEREIGLDEFPSPAELWGKYIRHKGLDDVGTREVVSQNYHSDGSDMQARYYQQVAINRTVEAIAKGQDRVLLVMATGTGKTYTAFQIIYRLWKSGAKKRILFLADRTALIDQTRKGDFKHFKEQMTVIRKKVVDRGGGKDALVGNRKRGIDSSDKAYEVFLGLYQGLTSGEDGIEQAYQDFTPGFFDLIVVDECHRGSAKDDSAWRAILDYFHSATHIGLTATPLEKGGDSNAAYFGRPIYTYSLKKGIDDGFLAPYKVVNVTLNVDANGYRPEKGKLDKQGRPLEDRIYGRNEFDRTLVIEERRLMVARKITEFLKGFDRMAKTIVFCQDIEHAIGMRSALVNSNDDLYRLNPNYVVRITGDTPDGEAQLDNFITPTEPYPVIATTSELMTTGVDAQTCKLIVLDSEIKSMTKFKQIIGRGTRINEDYGKLYFTILDFRNVTNLFADPDFDGDAEDVVVVEGDNGDLGNISGGLEEGGQEEGPEEGPLVNLPPDGIDWEDQEGPLINRGPRHVPREKIYANGIDVTILSVRNQHFDNQGRLITTSLEDHTRELIRGRYASLDDFLNHWNSAERKAVLLDELRLQGLLIEELESATNRQADPFDLICHLAFGQSPLTRAERVRNVRKRDAFTRYGEQARKVLDALLDKYADRGVTDIESMEVLNLKPFDAFGSRTEIVNGFFGGKPAYLEALRDLEQELYRSA